MLNSITLKRDHVNFPKLNPEAAMHQHILIDFQP